MGNTCTVCSHPKREAIEAALLRRESLRSIAERTGTKKNALSHHRKTHLVDALTHATEARAIHADNLIEQMRTLHEHTIQILERAHVTGNLHIALGAIREARANIELLAEMTGELDQKTKVNVNVMNVDASMVAGLRDTLAAKLGATQLPAAQPRGPEGNAPSPQVVDAKFTQ